MSCKFHKAIFHALLAAALYAVAPFIGVILSMLILGERPNWIFFIALAMMLLGTHLASTKAEE
ncbi:MAG: EamA family transporter [Alistipes sp.]|nr:EamA family transporter [Alistipes sp.]